MHSFERTASQLADELDQGQVTRKGSLRRLSSRIGILWKADSNGGAWSHNESVSAHRLGFEHCVQPQIKQQAAHLP